MTRLSKSLMTQHRLLFWARHVEDMLACISIKVSQFSPARTCKLISSFSNFPGKSLLINWLRA